MKCAGCLKVSKDCIKCTSPACGKYFCSLCINVAVLSVEKKKTWNCPDCIASTKKGGDNSSTPVRTNSDVQNITLRKKTEAECNSSELKELTSELRALTQEICSLKQRLEEATTSLTQCHKRLDDLSTTVASNEVRIQAIEDKETEVTTLRIHVEQLQRELNAQAQSHLRNEIEIIGIPENQNENLHHIALVMARKIGADVVDNDIDWITRAGPRQLVANRDDNIRKPLPRPIVIRFIRRSKRDHILKASKARKNLNSEELDVPGLSARVYINERLTKENRMLFRETRLRAKANGYNFCWCSNGVVYVRQREGKNAIQVASRSIMEDIFGKSINVSVDKN